MSKSLPVFHASRLIAPALVLALAACSGAGAPPATDEPLQTGLLNAESLDPASEMEATSNRLGELDDARLRALARQAIDDQRVHAPAGDNTVEYYLALRAKAPQDASISSALVEFQPYVLIAAEQALARAQPDEGGRLLELLARIDAQAPALPRMRAALAQLRTALAEQATATQAAALAAEADAQQRAEDAKERASVERLANIGAFPRAVERGGESPRSVPADADVARAPVAAAAEPAAPAPAIAMTNIEPAAPARPAPPRPAKRALPRLIEDQVPRYPLVAMNRKLEGRVEVAFTITPDGRVTGARVVSANPAGVFDRAALAAAARWRFESTGSTASTTRTLTFSMPKG